MKSAQSVTCAIMLAAGSRYETPDTNGIAHFAEHMFFKGTERRPSAREIGMEVDSLGAEFNAFTSKEYTGYYVKCAADYRDRALDVLVDMLRNSKFEPEEIEREKGVIVEEMNMYYDTPRDFIGGVYDQLLYGDQPLGWDIIGRKETVRAAKRETFLDYVERWYKPVRMVVGLGGRLDGDALGTVERLLGDLEPEETAAPEPVRLNGDNGPSVTVHHKDSDPEPRATGKPLVGARLGDGPILDLVDHRRVGQRGRVAKGAVLGHVTQQAAHDLAAAGLRQLRGEDDVRGLCDGTDLRGDVVAELLELLDRALLAALQRHVGDDRLAGAVVLASADRGLGDLGMVDERALDLDRGDAVAGDVHHVVHPAEQPEVAVLVDARTVARKVGAGVPRPVRLAVTLVVLVDPPQHCRPRAPQDEVAAPARPDLVPLLVVDGGVDPGEGSRGRAGLQRRHARQRRDHDHPRLGLPPGVHDRGAIAADVLAVPDPGLRVDGLADGAEQA